MKFAIIENEFYAELDLAFTLYKNLFNPHLTYDVFVKSQDIPDFKSLAKYDLIFVDLDLSFHSDLDGFNIIKKILDEKIVPKEKIIVITALKEGYEFELEKRGLPKIKALFKAITYKTLDSFLKPILSELHLK